MVKETGKRTLYSLKQQAETEAIRKGAEIITNKVKAPEPVWVVIYTFIVPVVQQKVASLTDSIRARFPQLFRKESEPEEQVAVPPTPVSLQKERNTGFDSLYHKYRCWQTNPLGCEWTHKTLEEEPLAQYCSKCGFPVNFLPKAELRGYRGRYKIESYIGYRGMGRLYRAIQGIDQQPVIIKEYPLPDRCFNFEETRQRKQMFERLAGLSLADGRTQDIRLVVPWDAFCDVNNARCYLVTSNNVDAYPTLRAYLDLNGAMTSQQVYRVLNQVLQTLQFLHGQKYRLPSSDIQKSIVHGNISLDSLLITTNTKEFFIHVCDLTLWESLFYRPTATTVQPSVANDLKTLGYVAFYLLAGGTEDKVTNITYDPKVNQHWSTVEPALKVYILKLLGFDIENTFASAEEARQALLQISFPQPSIVTETTAVPEVDHTKLRYPPIWLFSILGTILLGSLLWLAWQKYEEVPETIAEEVNVCCLSNVSGVPPGNYTYTGTRTGSWSYITRSARLILKNQTLEDILKQRQPKLQLNYQPEDTTESALGRVKSSTDFAVISLVDNLTPELQHQVIAYDGLVIFVAFSYAKRENSLPIALNGKITFQQLRDLYAGKITNWRQLGGANLPVKLYIPQEESAIRLFEQRVLKDKSAIAAFRNLQKSQASRNTFVSTISEIKALPTGAMLQNVLRDFEINDIGSIGFGTVSQVFGQCSAYPLALADDDKSEVEPLIRDNGNNVDPSTDLCNDKGNYRPNTEVFKNGSYPLSYPIAVVYPRDNSRNLIGRKFAEMMKTQEIQRLLRKAGLIL